MAFKDKAAFGKRQEFAAIAELLKRGFDVYQTLVDDKQIDCILREGTGANPVYLDIQIKALSKGVKEGTGSLFAGIKVTHPRDNYFFILYSEIVDQYWIMPGNDLIHFASKNEAGKNVGQYTIEMLRYSKKSQQYTFKEKFEKYRGNFDILRQTESS